MQETGLDPTLGAILPLVGVIVGILLGGGVSYLIKRRDERREFRAVARLLGAQLEDTIATIEYALEHRAWGALHDVDSNGELWRDHQLLVGRFLVRDHDWQSVAKAFRHAHVSGLLVGGAIQPSDRERIGRELITTYRLAAEVFHGRSKRRWYFRAVELLRR